MPSGETRREQLENWYRTNTWQNRFGQRPFNQGVSIADRPEFQPNVDLASFQHTNQYFGQNPAPGQWSLFPTQWNQQGEFGWVPRAQLADQRGQMFAGSEGGLGFGGPGVASSEGIWGSGGFGTSFESLGFGAGGGGNWSRRVGW